MIKSWLLLFNLLFITTIKIWAQDVKVTQKVPSSVKQGSEFQVDVFVEKKGIEGFAKLQFALPIGLGASAVESKGAAFSFKDQLVNFVWMSLPGDESFTLSYKVNVSSTVFGEDSITGKFNFIQNNEKQTYIVPAMVVDIQISGNGTSAPTANNSSGTETSNPIAETTNTTVQNTGNEIKTEVTEVAKEVEHQNPTAEVKEAVAEVVKETPKPAEKPIEKPVEKPAEVKPEKPAAKIANAVAQPGVVFKVQIAALSNQAKAGAFSALSEVSTFKAPDGLNKYYSGNFNSYDAAQQHLSSVKGKGFENAFIAAFKNGAPISVREALGK